MNIFASIISPELVIELYNQGFRPPTEAKSGQVWYHQIAKCYWRFEDRDKATQFSATGQLVDMDFTIPKDLTNLIYSPTEFELNEYLSAWVCTERNGTFICHHKNEDQNVIYQADKESRCSRKNMARRKNKTANLRYVQTIERKGISTA